MNKHVFRRLISLCVLSGFAYNTTAAPTFDITALGTLDGTESYASGINDLNQIVGYWINSNGDRRAFVGDTVTGLTDLGTLGGSFSYARDINNSGQVVSFSRTANGDQHAFVGNATDGLSDLGTLGGASSSAYAINDAGQIVGGAENEFGVVRAFVGNATQGLTDLGTLGAVPVVPLTSIPTVKSPAQLEMEAGPHMRLLGMRPPV